LNECASRAAVAEVGKERGFAMAAFGAEGFFFRLGIVYLVSITIDFDLKGTEKNIQ